MESNLKIWNELKQPPPEALKPITGGRLKGKTDISPIWRYKVMTELFGACGVGWRYEVDKLWLEPAGNEICAFAQVSLTIKVDGEWSEAIPGIGGSMMLEQESKGLHVSDECYKMAITDALSVAMKMIGVAADVYAGLFDGSKYATESKPAQTPRRTTPVAGKTTTDKEWENLESTAQGQEATKPTTAPPLKNIGELYTRASKYGISPSDVCEANNVGAGSDIVDLDAAWKATAAKFAKTIKAAQEAAKKDQ